MTKQVNSYEWHNIPIGGGGYVTGIVAHPKEPGLIYVRTDVGGAYRWDGEQLCWVPLCESFGIEDRNLYGIDGIALDPNNTDIVYLAAGEFTYLDGHDVLKSSDRGRTWTRTHLDKMFAGNLDYRWAGEPLAVDPVNSDIVYAGTRYDGLWVSTDGANSWQQVAGIPSSVSSDPAIQRGIRTIVFDPASAAEGLTRTLYVSDIERGIYRSDDGGETWTAIEGSPTHILRLELGENGELIAACELGVFKYACGQWKDISPEQGQSYNALSVQASNRQCMFVSQAQAIWENAIFLTVDGGETWKKLNEVSEHQADVPWWPKGYFAAATAASVFLPHEGGALWYTDWYGIWMTDDVFADRIQWYTRQSGHEEMCAFTMLCPPEGSPLITAIADNDGMRHDSFDRYPVTQLGGPEMQETTGIDFVESSPDWMARVGSWAWGQHGSGGWSNDYGRTWREFAAYPQNEEGVKLANGKIAVSAQLNPYTGLPDLVTLPIDSIPYVSGDLGLTWQPAEGAPSGAVEKFWSWNIPLASDRMMPGVFYYFCQGKFHRSVDGGKTWAITADLPNEPWHLVKTAPGHGGHVWVSLNEHGLYRSTDSGMSFSRLDTVEQAYLFAIGKPYAETNYPCIFVYGRIAGVDGVFVSYDEGEHWERISNDSQRMGVFPCCMEGDRQQPGVVYIGTQGRGFYRGVPG